MGRWNETQIKAPREETPPPTRANLKPEFLELCEQIRAHAVRVVRLEIGHVHEIRTAQLQQPSGQRGETQELLIALGRNGEKHARDRFEIALDAELQAVVENEQLVDQLCRRDVRSHKEKKISKHAGLSSKM